MNATSPTWPLIAKPLLLGTTHTPFKPYEDFDPASGIVANSSSTRHDHFESISYMPTYRDYSFEELRVQDYILWGKTVIPCKGFDAPTDSPHKEEGFTPQAQERAQSSASAAQAVDNPNVERGSREASPSQNSIHVASSESLSWVRHELFTNHSVYYSNPRLHVVSDLDVSDERNLAFITTHLNGWCHVPGAKAMPQGWELWLRNTTISGEEIVLQNCWVDHNTTQLHVSERAPFFDNPADENDGAASGSTDQSSNIDNEGRYWEFIESHPNHVHLPLKTRVEVINMLTAVYTDLVLFPLSQEHPPFTKTECWELLSLFRTFNDDKESHLYHTLTRAVAQVMLRYMAWKRALSISVQVLPDGSSAEATEEVLQTPGIETSRHDMPSGAAEEVRSERVETESVRTATGEFDGSAPRRQTGAAPGQDQAILTLCVGSTCVALLLTSLLPKILPTLEEVIRVVGLSLIVYYVYRVLSGIPMTGTKQ
ncbi:hypothetical protein K474DRAFT_1662336 [Panus rudis PR-1116 ss-1]|nr:hypothetical protein K474DRAFT_1662336 [Panus rudis PR-1116 ss-1]